MDQQYADNVKYDGELSTPSSDIGTAYAKLLIPILSIREDLRVVNERILEPNGSSLSQAQSLLNQPQYQSKELKRIFNAFADNIYYSDPDRANLYLAGGATPKTAQSLAYLLRNELLTSLDDLRTEIADLIKDREKGGVTTASRYSLGDHCYYISFYFNGAQLFEARCFLPLWCNVHSIELRHWFSSRI